MSDLVKASDEEKRGYLVREARVQKKLEFLQQQYFEITTIKDVLIVQSAAEALATMTRELEVHERYRNDAEAMIRRCEIRLGEITRSISTKGTRAPLHRNGGIPPRPDVTSDVVRQLRAQGLTQAQIAKQLRCSPGLVQLRLKDTTRIPGPPKPERPLSKRAILKAARITSKRAAYAEKLAMLPKGEQERLVKEASSIGGMLRMAGVRVDAWMPPRTFVRALLNELENRRRKPRDPVLDALQAQWRAISMEGAR